MQLRDLANIETDSELGETIYGEGGQPLLQRGVKLSAKYLEKLARIGLRAVYVNDPDTSDIEAPEPVSPESRAKAVHNLSHSFEHVGQMCKDLRKSSVEEMQEHLRSERFADTLRSGTGVGALSADVDQFLDQLMNREILVGLNSIKTHDSYTFQHSIDVTIMAIVLAKKMGWDRSRLKSFAMGCFLHDIGKIFIDAEILNKPGRPTTQEFARIKMHPTLGFEVIKAMAPSIGPLAPQVAYQHHEKQDGSGYPRGLKGNQILGQNLPLQIHDFGAVSAVADIYDAMSSDRPYRAGWAPDRVVTMIRELAGTHLNRMGVEVFLQTVAPYPVCTDIRVTAGRYTGWKGIVAKVSRPSLNRPRVRLLFNPTGTRVNPLEIDLRQEVDCQIECVQKMATEVSVDSPEGLKSVA